MFVLAAGSVAGRAGDGDTATRAPVPEPAARGGVVVELKAELKDEFKSKDPAVRKALARKLIGRAEETKDAPLRRFVLLDQAILIAEELRDIPLALECAGKMSESFVVGRAARGAAAIDAMAKGSKETGFLAEAAAACVDLAGDALDEDDPAAAAKAIAAAKTHAKAAKLGGLAARAGELANLVAAYKTLAAAAEAAKPALATAADDPAANEALGRFLCFGRGRWTEGLPHLAKQTASPAGAAAAAALAASESSPTVATGDAWWDAAQKEKDPLAKARMIARALADYDAASVPADAAARVKTRIDSVTYSPWNGGVALMKDFSKDGPASLGLGTIRTFIAEQKINRDADGWRTRLPRFPDVTFTRGEEYLWHLDTNQGAITLRFFADTAPKHVANFLYLTELGFFDGLSFHRVIPGFMAQGGCPKGSGSGDPGYTFESEFGGDRKHDKPGILSMANTGAPKSDGSQFFITFVPTPNLDGKHTVFGEVIDGMDVVSKLEAQGTPGGPTKTPLVIKSARVSVR